MCSHRSVHYVSIHKCIYIYKQISNNLRVMHNNNDGKKNKEKREKQLDPPTCCKIGLMYFNGNGENLFCFKKSYKFCSSISNTRHVWFLCWKHSNARTKLNSSAFSWLRRERIDTSICPWRAYDGWFLRILMATISLVPFFQHLTTCPNVPRPKNSRT